MPPIPPSHTAALPLNVLVHLPSLGPYPNANPIPQDIPAHQDLHGPIEVREAPAKLVSSPRPLRPGRTCSSATGAVSLFGGGNPVLLIHRPAAVSLPHLRLGYMYPANPVGLADIQLWQTFWTMAPSYPLWARRSKLHRGSTSLDFREGLLETV